MFDLTPAERLELAELTVRRVSGRVPVVACAGFGDTAEQQLRSIREMADTGVDAVVLPLSVLFPEETSGELVAETLLRLPERLPGITLGLYECPVPYKRSISPELLGKLARDCGNRYRFLKDTCCDRVQLHARCAAAAGSGLAVYNANLTTLTDSLRNGCARFQRHRREFLPRRAGRTRLRRHRRSREGGPDADRLQHA